MALYTDLKVGESITLDHITLTLEEKSGKRARLRVDAKNKVLIGKPKTQLSMPPRAKGNKQ